MSISSMTGFARVPGAGDGCSWLWEAKSVNGKGRDLRCRLPVGYEHLEPKARDAAASRFKRGNISLTLTITWTQSSVRYRINQEVLDQVVALLPDLRARLPEAEAPRLDGLLALRGVIESSEEEMSEDDRAALEAGLVDGLGRVLDGLAETRAEEGARLEPVIKGLVDRIQGLAEQAEGLAATRPQAIAEQLRARIAEVIEAGTDLPEERLAQEVAVLAAKADVREELDRLKAHVTAAHDLLDGDGGVGRNLDFLCQEFNREANTLCSKSSDVELTRVGLDLKSVIDQLREQVQNIE